ncbi:calcium-responsive transcription factor [Hydra vulgaris]|uniref:calcium-responsive transcription factor n=1 Tax=Hydra vulgaris TaxID=6087 RepID=UPI0032E9E2DE
MDENNLGDCNVCEIVSSLDPKDFVVFIYLLCAEPESTTVPFDFVEKTYEERYIFNAYRDVCLKLKEHQILHTVHYVSAFSRRMGKELQELTKKNHKVFFEDKDFPYSGVPFIISSQSTLDCQQGKDRNVKVKAEYREKKNDEAARDHSCRKHKNIVQVTKKFDCPAKVHIKEILKFPEFKVYRDSEWLRKDTSKKLCLALTGNKNMIVSRKYVLIIPDITVHRNHLIGNAAGLLQPISDELVIKIGELVKVGVNSVTEMRPHLENFVHINFSSRSMPNKSNKRFFPLDETIRNHMLKARKKMCHSLIDQECLNKKVAEWANNYKKAFIKFRPKGENNSEDNNQDLQKSLLFIFQDKWQRRLLLRYGNELSFLDATYRTTRYALPLFFLVVKTNVDYQIVAIFVCKNETTEAIKEALIFIKKWNPSFQPKYFMTDYSNEEINSLESVFPGKNFCYKRYFF